MSSDDDFDPVAAAEEFPSDGDSEEEDGTQEFLKEVLGELGFSDDDFSDNDETFGSDDETFGSDEDEDETPTLSTYQSRLQPKSLIQTKPSNLPSTRPSNLPSTRPSNLPSTRPSNLPPIGRSIGTQPRVISSQSSTRPSTNGQTSTRPSTNGQTSKRPVFKIQFPSTTSIQRIPTTSQSPPPTASESSTPSLEGSVSPPPGTPNILSTTHQPGGKIGRARLTPLSIVSSGRGISTQSSPQQDAVIPQSDRRLLRSPLQVHSRSAPILSRSKPEIITASGKPLRKLVLTPVKPEKPLEELLKPDPGEEDKHFEFRKGYTQLAKQVLTNHPYKNDYLVAIGRAKANKVFLGNTYTREIEEIINRIDTASSNT